MPRNIGLPGNTLGWGSGGGNGYHIQVPGVYAEISRIGAPPGQFLLSGSVSVSAVTGYTAQIEYAYYAGLVIVDSGTVGVTDIPGGGLFSVPIPAFLTDVPEGGEIILETSSSSCLIDSTRLTALAFSNLS